jgi:hypothetical protein
LISAIIITREFASVAQLCSNIIDARQGPVVAAFLSPDDAIDQLRRHQAAARVRIPVEPGVSRRKLDELSAGIALEAGRLHIEFAGAEDLLAKLYELAQAASNDFDRFRAAGPARFTHHVNSLNRDLARSQSSCAIHQLL